MGEKICEIYGSSQTIVTIVKSLLTKIMKFMGPGSGVSKQRRRFNNYIENMHYIFEFFSSADG